MKVSQLALAGTLLIAICSIADAQSGMYASPAGPMTGGYAGSQMGYPQMAPGMYPQQGMYPQAMPAAYAQMQPGDAQQALYGPAGPMSGGPGPMDGGEAGDGSCGCGGGCGCGQGCCGPAGAQCYDDGGIHYAYGSIELFYARRTNGTINQPLVVDAATQATVFTTTHDFSFGYEPGVKGTAGYMFSQGWGIEGTYFGQFDFNTGVITTSDTPSLAAPGALGNTTTDFTAVSQLVATYASRIHNGEVNFILPYGSWQFLAGFRYMEVDEFFNLQGVDSGTATEGDYTIQTSNHLYGGQLGSRGQWQIGRLILDAECKAGVFCNATEQHQTVTDAGDQLRDAGGHEHQAAFVGEVNAYAFVPFGSNVTARLGYSAIWVDDLALAPDQLDFSNTGTSGAGIFTRGSTLIHGFNAGVEFRF